MKRVVLWTALLLFLGSLAGAAWFGSYLLQPGPPQAERSAVVYIPKGSSIKQISELLGEAGLVRDDPRFLLLTKLMGISSKLQAGEFSLPTGQRPAVLLREYLAARPMQHLVTIPEGWRLEEIAALFARDGWADADIFISLARDPDVIEKLGFKGITSLEGYLFPDTYSLTRPAAEEQELIRMLVTRALQVWGELAPGQTPLSRHEVFTLASIIEKETGQPSERPLIASVFLNRLARKMRLQSDPTVIYGIDDFSGNLTRTHLQTPTPYNTYTISGLPPGPICSPGKAALQAVLQPAEADFLYFVSKKDGSHHFSRSLREHNRMVRKYLRGKNSAAEK